MNTSAHTPIPRHQRPSRLPKFLFGTPYYPEHWSAEDWKDDAARMASAGMNVVRMGEFAWDRMEPRRGAFDFALFDETLVRLGAHGIDAILCTPTATPPRWLTSGHEDRMRVDADGRRMRHGSRQHCCTNNPDFRAESERITRAMAIHFADNPRVIGWQTDNELFCQIQECYCKACEAAFRIWLEKKYGDVASLNRRWGTAFWALTYDSFAQIELPYPARPAYPNPSHQLDYLRFLSDGISEFQRGQVNILREIKPNWWITHNGTFKHVDYWKFTADLDFLGVDVYPAFEVDQLHNFYKASYKHEEARAASGSYIVPEQQGGAGGQPPYLNSTPAPGQMRLWAYQSIAHGADGILHFRWRTCRFGAEIYWNGIIDHDNIPRRRYLEFAQEGAELKQVGDKILGTVLRIDIGILADHDQEEAHATMSLGLPSPKDQRRLLYREMLQRHLPVGLVDATDLFDGLKVMVVPSFVLMDEALALKLSAFVEQGGVLVAMARTATRNRDNQVISQTPPGLLSELFGVTVEEFGKLHGPLMNLGAGTEQDIPAGASYEILQPHGAEVLAHWSASLDGARHAAPGQPAVTMHRVGKGAAIYIGTYFSEENTAALVNLLLEHAPNAALADAPAFVEITCRRSAERNLLFVLNHSAHQVEIRNLPPGIDLLSREKCYGQFALSAYGVAVIEVENISAA